MLAQCTIWHRTYTDLCVQCVSARNTFNPRVSDAYNQPLQAKPVKEMKEEREGGLAEISQRYRSFQQNATPTSFNILVVQFAKYWHEGARPGSDGKEGTEGDSCQN